MSIAVPPPQVPPPPRPSSGPEVGQGPTRRPGEPEADVRIHSTSRDRVKVDVNPRDKGGSGWPKDGEDWKDLLKRAVPWLVAAGIIAAGVSAYKQSADEDDDNLSYGELTRRKAARAKGRAADKLEEGKDAAQRGWFGFKSRAEDTADEVAANAREAKQATRGAFGRAEEAVRDKAADAKEGAVHAKDYVAHKAHDVADAAKGAAHKVEHGVAQAGSKVIATGAAAEEQTGRVLKDTGKKLEEDGRSARKHYSGEELKEEKKKEGKCTIM